MTITLCLLQEFQENILADDNPQPKRNILSKKLIEYR